MFAYPVSANDNFFVISKNKIISDNFKIVVPEKINDLLVDEKNIYFYTNSKFYAANVTTGQILFQELSFNIVNISQSDNYVFIQSKAKLLKLNKTNLQIEEIRMIEGIDKLYSLFGICDNCSQGTPGPQGPPGPQGMNGTNGINGSDGSQGPQGIQGIQGIQGVNGTNGINGSNGSQGPQGIQGIQGLQGVNGTNGINQSDPLKINKTDIGEASGGILSDLRLSSNVPMKNANNNWSARNYFSNNFMVSYDFTIPPAQAFIIRPGQNKNFGITLGTVSGSLALSGINDNATANIPLEFRSNGLYFTTLSASAQSSALCLNSSSGLVTYNSGLTTCLSSSKKYKTNISYISQNSTNLTKKLKPVTYNDISDNTKRVGFIAEDIYSDMPVYRDYLIGYELNNLSNVSQGYNYSDPRGLNYEGLLTLSIKTLQEQINKTEILEAKLNTICSKNQSLCR
jgi:hypothetical protein